MSLSVAECLRSAIIGRVFSHPTWSILFLNRPTAIIISTLFRKSQILKQKILTILRTENENYPDGMEKFDVIYFVYLDRNTIKNIKKDIDQKKFKKYRIVFTGWSGHTGQMFSRDKRDHSTDILNEIKQLFKKQNKTSNLTIIPFKLDYNTINDHVFTPIVQSDNGFIDQNILHQTVQSLCKSFRITPRIVNLTHFKIEKSNDSTETIETMKISEELMGTSPICLFLNRNVDLYTPFLHFFEFETYLSDLGIIDIKFGEKEEENTDGKKYESGQYKQDKTKKEAPLNKNMNDRITTLMQHALWKNLRHLHLAELNAYLIEQARKLNEEMAVIGVNQKKEDDSLSLSTLRAAVLNAPSLIAKKQSLDTAITLCEKVLGQFPRHEGVSLIEQDLVEKKNVIPEIVSLIVDQKTKSLYDQGVKGAISYPISRSNSIRLLFLLYTNGFRLNDSQLMRITDKLLLSEREIGKIKNVKQTIIFKVQDGEYDSNTLIEQFQKYCKQNKWKYQVSRYTPLVVQLVDSLIVENGPVYEQALEGSSNRTEVHSLRKTTNRKMSKNSNNKFSSRGSKLVIVSIPYLTVSELVLLRRLSEIRNFTIWICTNEIVNQGEIADKIMNQ